MQRRNTTANGQILNRANVGRSAFYAHFHDKHALLASGIHQMLREGSPRPLPSGAKRFRNVVWFGFPVFEYVNPLRHTEGSLMAREDHTIIHEHLRQVLIDMIAEEVSTSVSRPESGASHVPPELLAQYVAGTFILVLNWWVDSNSVPALVGVTFSLKTPGRSGPSAAAVVVEPSIVSVTATLPSA